MARILRPYKHGVMMIAAAIDIGTNSVKLVVGETDPAGEARLLREDVLITRLGENLDATGLLGRDGLRRTLEGVRGLVEQARAAGATTVRAVATSAMRDAANRDDFVRAVKGNAGIEIEVLSGQEEARLARSAVVLDPVLGSYRGEQVTVDVGGGSTEFTFGQAAASLDLGAVRLHERFIKCDPPSPEEVESAAAFAEDVLKMASLNARDARMVGMGGSVVNIARMLGGVPCEEYAQVHGSALTASDIRRMIERLASLKIEQRRSMAGLDPERADIILTGAIILGAVLRVMEKQEMVVSVRGLRHGVLYEMLGVTRWAFSSAAEDCY